MFVSCSRYITMIINVVLSGSRNTKIQIMFLLMSQHKLYEQSNDFCTVIVQHKIVGAVRCMINIINERQLFYPGTVK